MLDEIVLYMHAGSGNHGCEAIVNSLCHMFHRRVKVVTNDKKEDERYSIGELCELIQERKFSRHKIAHVLYYIYRKLTGDKDSFIRYRYYRVMGKNAPKTAVSIGGDNYCYDMMLNDLFLSNSAFHKAGTKTILAGCSIEPVLLERKEIREDLAKYRLILARESITFEALKKVFSEGEGCPEIKLCPDPAFTLQTKEVILPEGFAEGNTIGINLSPLIQEKEGEKGMTMENYRGLIRYLMENTDMQIALIPHVVWERNNDRIPLRILYQEFAQTGRVVMIEDGTCEELKGYISKCRMFIGARTHATIAAYSTCVPTLVVGYSVKAKGIAQDIFGSYENYVIPVQQIKKENELTACAQWLLEHEDAIRKHLEQTMPSYCERALENGREIERIFTENTYAN